MAERRQKNQETESRQLLERYYTRLSSAEPATALATLAPDLAPDIVSTAPAQRRIRIAFHRALKRFQEQCKHS